jgi:hypothetical protein
MPELCPHCSSPLPANAVLCVQCGFHLPSGTILATQFDRPAETPPAPIVDPNPYAAPAIEAAPPRPGLGGKAVFDLTEHAARRAKGVVQDADNVYIIVLLATACLCGVLWLVMFPWYSLRLIQWYSLNSQYEELRHPNAFSPYAEITARFPDAKFKLWVGTVVGGVLLALLGLAAMAG